MNLKFSDEDPSQTNIQKTSEINQFQATYDLPEIFLIGTLLISNAGTLWTQQA